MQVQIVFVTVLFLAVSIAGKEQSNYREVKPAYEQQHEPMPYAFAWAVKDEPSSNDYAHQQESDGKVTTGSYRVILPDGRTQMVAYRSDENGYVVDVKFEGETKYPQYQPSLHNNKESYPLPKGNADIPKA
ncbi:pro-resilin [Daphnia magna]|uniref:Uncharacterized protein n=2 Tax=Daphnia magna TaxID=35525 RepID=A0ABQ9ZAT3_9CRUS|nr:pro-resilin [Daphnia magna]KAK4010007.1 hypothetical protein OUZ56_019155 [Daphnia magna]KZS05290.1 putative Cuticular protein [Daphnia magna]